MLLGMDKEVWEIMDNSRDLGRTRRVGAPGYHQQGHPKMSVGTSLFDQIMFYVRPEIPA